MTHGDRSVVNVEGILSITVKIFLVPRAITTMDGLSFRVARIAGTFKGSPQNWFGYKKLTVVMWYKIISQPCRATFRLGLFGEDIKLYYHYSKGHIRPSLKHQCYVFTVLARTVQNSWPKSLRPHQTRFSRLSGSDSETQKLVGCTMRVKPTLLSQGTSRSSGEWIWPVIGHRSKSSVQSEMDGRLE